MNKKNYPEEVKKISYAFKSAKTFFIAMHQNPDGDTLGAALCSASVLKNMNKKVYVFSTDKIPNNLKFMPFVKWVNEKKLPKADKKFDVCLFFECSVLKRAGNVEEIAKNSGKIINIDHHRTYSHYGDINYVDSTASSTSELIFKVFTYMGIDLTSSEAQCLYVGIVTDTGRFYYKNSTPNAHKVAAQLIGLGIKAWKINEKLYATKSLPALKIISKALESLKIINKHLAVMHLSRKDFKSANALPEHTEDIANYGLMPEQVKVSLLIKELPECTAVNLRAKNFVDVSRIAKKFGGGGHKNAAGFKTNTKSAEIKPKLIKEIKKLLKKR